MFLCIDHSQSLSPCTYTQSCLKSPVFQSLKSATSMTLVVRIVQHSSVLSVNRTWMKSLTYSHLCSAQSTTLPWTPGYCLPAPPLRASGFTDDLHFFMSYSFPLTSDLRQLALGSRFSRNAIRASLPCS